MFIDGAQTSGLEPLSRGEMSLPWRAFLRFLVLGPVTGAVIGFVQTTAAALVWILYGQPEFFFRGWNGVMFHYMTFTVGGSMVGVVYGVILLTFERVTGQEIRLRIVIPWLACLAFGVALAIVVYEFEQGKLIRFYLAREVGAIAMGLLLSVMNSRRPGTSAVGDEARVDVD